MAASITRRILRLPILSVNQQVYNPARLKYWERGEDSIYEKGESFSDRHIGIPQKEKPHPETPMKGLYEVEPIKGKIYDRKPFPVQLKAGVRYKWCSCGYSKSQPFCDGHHKIIANILRKEKSDAFIHSGQYQPVWFEVEEDGKYWLCNCKQTDNRPFCDGTHRSEEIRQKIRP